MQALALLVILTLGVACSSASAPNRPASASKPPPAATDDEDAHPSTPDTGSSPSTDGTGKGTSTATTAGAYPIESRSKTMLSVKGAFGSGQAMLDLVGAKRSVTLAGPAGDPGLVLDVDVAYHNEHPNQGEMWLVNETPRPGDMAVPHVYAVVPVHIHVRSQDGRIDQSWDDGELVTGEAGRVSLEAGYTGPLSGSLDLDDLAKIDPACVNLFVAFDFRSDETRARLTFENDYRHPCLEWATKVRPVSWRVIESAATTK